MRKIILNFILLFVTILICLVFFEIILANFYPQEINKYMLKSFNEYHPNFGWYNKLNYNSEFVKCNNKVKINTDSYGFRANTDLNLSKKVVLVFGDSFIFGDGLDDNELYTTYLQEYLGSDYLVLNLGVSGYGPDQMLMQLSTVEIKPTIILWAFYPNDLLNLMFGRYSSEGRGIKPVFELNKTNDLVLFNCCPVPKSDKTYFKEKKYFRNFHSFAFFSESLSNPLNLFKQQDLQKFYSTSHDSEFLFVKNKDRILSDRFRNLLKNEFPYKVYSKIYSEALNISNEFGSEFVLVSIPSRFQVDNKYFDLYLKNYYDVNSSHFERFLVNEKISSIVNESYYLDLYSMFLERDKVKNDFNKFYQCGNDIHWNSLGTLVAANETFNYLKLKNLISVNEI